MLLEQRQKGSSVEQDRKPRIKPTHLIYNNKATIDNGEKTVPSINGAG